MSTNNHCQICGGTGVVLSRMGTETPCICRNYATPKPRIEPLKGSTEEPMTDELDIRAQAYDEGFADGCKFMEQSEASPLEPLHELPTDEEIEDAWHKMINVSKSVGFVNGAKWMRDRIGSRLLPSNPESPSNEWIPVSTPPEIGEEYNVVWDLEDGDDLTVTTMDYDFIKKQWIDRVTGSDETARVKAWMPLPSPPTTKD